jgi:hypothetical protein
LLITKTTQLRPSEVGTFLIIFGLLFQWKLQGKLQELQFMLNQMQVNPNECDKWSYIWGSGEYFTKKAYLPIIGVSLVSPIFQWMCKSCGRGKHKFFFLFLLKDRLNTRELLKRKNMVLPDYNCFLCSLGVEEILIHLLFECLFSKCCWSLLNIQWDTSLCSQDMLIKGQRQFNSPIFREVLIVGGWIIWCHRNVAIFDGAVVSLGRWQEAFKDEFALITLRANARTKPLLTSWLSSLP